MDTSNIEKELRDFICSTSTLRGSMARQRYQRGSVKLRGQVWYGKYREDLIEQDGTVKRIRRNARLGAKKEYPTKRLAERRLEQILSTINSPGYRPGRMATVAEFAERWRTEILSKRKPSQQIAANSHLNFHIIPYLGKARLDALGVETQQTFVTHLSNKKHYKGKGTLSQKTVVNVMGTLSSMVNTAKVWGYICEGVSLDNLVLPERGVVQEARSFTVSEAQRIIAASENPYQLMYAIATFAGLRAGEIMGLRVRDVDLQNRILHIRQTGWYGKIQTAKSRGSETDLPIPGALAVLFERYMATWQTNPRELLFVNTRGNPTTAEKIVKKHLHPLLERLGIPHTEQRCGFHAFRHMHTSLLLESGASPKVAQRQLRHSDARITLGIYGHLVENSHREAVERLSKLLNIPV